MATIPDNTKGFTLVEAVIVIMITGVLGAIVAVFIRTPVNGYFDAAIRARMTDIADTAIRRVSRDVHRALPNSIRITGTFLELIPTTGGGRYRVEGVGTGNPCGVLGDSLDFSSVDTCFEVLGPTVAANNGDFLYVFNTGQCSAAGCAAPCLALDPGANAYQGCNRRQITAGGATIVFASTQALPFASPDSRFQVGSGTERAVTYACESVGTAGADGTGTLTRYWNYGFNPVQVTAGFTTSALLAQNVSACEFVFQAGVTERSGLVTMRISIMENNETVTLYHEVHVSNVP